MLLMIAHTKSILLIIAYTFAITSFIIQTICFRKKTSKLENIILPASFILATIILIIIELNLFQNKPVISYGFLYNTFCIVFISTCIVYNSHAERILKNKKIKNNVLFISSILIFTIILYFQKIHKSDISTIIAFSYISFTILYNIFVQFYYKASAFLKHRNIKEKITSIVLLLCLFSNIVPVYLKENFLPGFVLVLPYATSVLIIVVSISKFPDEVKKLILFTQNAEIDLKRLNKRIHITAREIEVLNLLVKGKNYNEIAAELFISVSTVKTHTCKIFKKLNVKNKIELITLI